MKTLARPLLWLLTTALPFAIAACYGTPQLYRQGGRVATARNGVGVRGITVRCLDGAAAPQAPVVAETTTGADGAFTLESPAGCTALDVADLDGDANGRYASRVVPVDACDGCATDVELHPAP